MPLKLLVFGAHPDDCDIQTGGLAALYTKHGHKVKFVSMTNGDAGHHQMGGASLAQRRNAEAQAAAEVIGIDYQLLDNGDGRLEPTLENRYQTIELIRQFKPDLVMTHRPNDYHPDHRYTSIIVQDAAYMVTVPNICPFVRHLDRNPIIMYTHDRFSKPYPFQPNVAVNIDSVIEQKLDMLHCHESQFYEWLPYNAGRLDEVPKNPIDRRKWLAQQRLGRFKHIADEHRDLLIKLYGQQQGGKIQYAEAFETSEYGLHLTTEKREELFLSVSIT